MLQKLMLGFIRISAFLPTSRTASMLERRHAWWLSDILVSGTDFLFTALLPAAAFGNVETRSIIEANRKLMQGKGRYFEAACTSIDPKNRVLGACFPKHAGLASHCFTLQYDILIAAVGSIDNTFGIKVLRHKIKISVQIQVHAWHPSVFIDNQFEVQVSAAADITMSIALSYKKVLGHDFRSLC